ncbi:MAG: hypothetical protein GY804_09570 [Alphaproteobacteria bacterium]|nr:hypothetical protein [Alphaproteobacteria bacterium]
MKKSIILSLSVVFGILYLSCVCKKVSAGAAETKEVSSNPVPPVKIGEPVSFILESNHKPALCKPLKAMLELPENSEFAKGADFRFFIPEKYKKDFSQPEWTEVPRNSEFLKIAAENSNRMAFYMQLPNYINKKGSPYYAVADIKIDDLPKIKVLRKGNYGSTIGASFYSVKDDSAEFKQALDKVAGFDADIDLFNKNVSSTIGNSVLLFYFRERLHILGWGPNGFGVVEIKKYNLDKYWSYKDRFLRVVGVPSGHGQAGFCGFKRKESVK